VFVDHLEDFSLGHDGVGNVQASIFPLDRLVYLNSITKPVVAFSRQTEFQSAKRVCDVFKRIDKAVSKVIGGIYTPLRASTMMWGVNNTVGNQIPELRVSIFQVHLHAQSDFTFLEATILHHLELFERFFD